MRRPGHDCKAKFHVWCVTDCSIALSNILEHFGRNSPQNRLHWIFMRHAKNHSQKIALHENHKKRRNRSYVYCFNMLSKIIIGSFGIEYQWLQWCQAAHICHNIRYLLMESMPYKSVFCKTHTKISKECLSFIGFVYYLFLSEKNWIFVNIVSAGEPQTFKTIWKRTKFLHCMLFWTHTLFWLSASKSNFKTKNVSSLVRAARVYVCLCECVCA